jgi:hypothetical protein
LFSHANNLIRDRWNLNYDYKIVVV